MRGGGAQKREEAFWINEGVENIYIYVSKTNSFPSGLGRGGGGGGKGEGRR